MKKSVLFIGVAVMLLSSSANAQKVIRINDDNSYWIGAKIVSVKSTKKGKKIKLKDICGNKHTMYLENYEWEDWEAEEGKIEKKQKVTITIYNNETPNNQKDDEVIHIMKRK